MSKQLTLSATLAAVCMILLAFAATQGLVGPDAPAQTASGAPLFDVSAAK